MSELPNSNTEPVEIFLVAIGIGVLIGLAPERMPSEGGGLRTFALVGSQGTLGRGVRRIRCVR